MIDWGAVTGVVAALAVAVTLVLFIIESRRRAVEGREKVRREAISRVLGAMESSIRRNQGILNSLRFWAHPDLEYALVIPRLVHDLGPKDSLIVMWAIGQTQAMLLATSDKSAAKIGREMCLKIVEWGQGRVNDDWLKSELAIRPTQTNFRLPWKIQVLRMLSRTKDSVLSLSVLSILAFTISKSWKMLFSSN